MKSLHIKLWNRELEKNRKLKTKMQAWTDEEQKFTLGTTRVIKRANFAFGLIFLVIGLLCQGMDGAAWLLFFAGVQGIVYFAACYSLRMTEERDLITPMAWLKRYPFDLLNIGK